MNSASEDIKDIIVAGSLAVFGTDLFIGMMPETTSICISIFDIPGLSPDLYTQWERPAIQLQTRGVAGGYKSAYAKIKTIADYLHGRQETRNGVIYKLIRQEGSINHVTTDEKNRPIFTTNFQIQRS